MGREHSARRVTDLVDDGIDPSDYRAAIPITRPGPEPAEASKQVLRLFAAYTLVGLPLHCCVCLLAMRSLGLATLAVLVVATALAAVAAAKWLALEDLLQKLPLLVCVALVGCGLIYLAGTSSRQWGTGSVEFFGTLFIVVAVLSVLSHLYRPLADAYQTVTLKIPVRDLAVAAAGFLVSLGLAAFMQLLTRPAATLLAFTVAGGFAALVVAEYVAWMRANPDRSLDREAVGPSKRGTKVHRMVLLGGIIAGFGYALFVVLLVTPPRDSAWTAPSPLLARRADGVTVMRLWSAAVFLGGVLLINAALDCLRRPKHPLQNCRLAWNALVVFLTYPGTTHPLAHRISVRWLRPQSVRLVLAGVTLCTTTTALLVRSNKSPEESTRVKPAAVAPAAATGTPLVPFAGADASNQFPIPLHQNGGTTVTAALPYAPHPVSTPPATEPRPSLPAATQLIDFAVGLVIAPPFLVYALVWVFGVGALPWYHARFEKPETGTPTH